MFCKMHVHTPLHTTYKGVFKTLSNIYDGAYLQKWLTTKNCNTSLFRNTGIKKIQFKQMSI